MSENEQMNSATLAQFLNVKIETHGEEGMRVHSKWIRRDNGEGGFALSGVWGKKMTKWLHDVAMCKPEIAAALYWQDLDGNYTEATLKFRRATDAVMFKLTFPELCRDVPPITFER